MANVRVSSNVRFFQEKKEFLESINQDFDNIHTQFNQNFATAQTLVQLINAVRNHLSQLIRVFERYTMLAQNDRRLQQELNVAFAAIMNQRQRLSDFLPANMN
jgi:ABC-type transporter Mla subunit MlaD